MALESNDGLGWGLPLCRQTGKLRDIRPDSWDEAGTMKTLAACTQLSGTLRPPSLD